MAVVVASQSLADGATLTSGVFDYQPDKVVTATCTNPTPAPTQTGQVKLDLSLDNVTWVTKRIKWFGTIPGVSYPVTFNLGEFATQAAWLYYRLVFYGQVGAAVTIAADEPSDVNQKVVTLTGLNSTNAGALGVWTPPWTGPTLVNNLQVYSTNNAGAGNMFAGPAVNAVASNAALINGALMTALAGTVITSGANNSSLQGIIPANGSLTFSGNGNSVGYLGKAYITYTKL